MRPQLLGLGLLVCLAACEFDQSGLTFHDAAPQTADASSTTADAPTGTQVDAGPAAIDAASNPDGPLPCPGVCDSCDGNGTCVITCSDASCDSEIVCPPDRPCRVTCTGNDVCAGGVDCSNATACDITCSGDTACAGGVTCAGTDCSVNCDGDDTCSSLNCNASSCDLSCTGDNACDNGTCCSGHNCGSSCTGECSC